MTNTESINQKGSNTDPEDKRLKNIFNNQISYLIGVIIVIVIVASTMNPNFLTLRNFLNIMQQISILGILTMCMSLLMISGGLDISIGNMAGLIGIIFARMLLAGTGTFVCVLVALAFGLLFGFVNGLIIAKSKVTPLIITLGMNFVFLGIALIIGGGRPQAITGEFSFLGEAKIGGIVPVSILIFVAVFLFAYFLRKYTKYGRRLNAIGGNSLSAYLSGINVDWHIVSVYVVSGFIVGFTALILVSRLGVVRANSGENYALQALAATIIGGITFEGGKGSLVGAFFGVILLGVLYNAMNVIGVNSYVQTIFLGAIIVIATVVANIGKMRR